jgi:hypothetical protein
MSAKTAAPYYFNDSVKPYGPPIAEFSSGRDAMIFATVKREAGEDCRVYAGLGNLPFAVHMVRR